MKDQVLLERSSEKELRHPIKKITLLQSKKTSLLLLLPDHRGILREKCIIIIIYNFKQL